MAATTDQQARMFSLLIGVGELVRDGKRDAEDVLRILQIIKEERKFAELLLAKKQDTLVPALTFALSVEGNRTASELIALGKYSWHNDWITDERFPIAPHDLVQRTIEYITFAHDPESEEVLAEFVRRGLKCPAYEDALYFGIQHPEEQRKHPIVWLHEPLQGPHGRRYVLVLYRDGRERFLHLGWFDRRWCRVCVFPAVRE